MGRTPTEASRTVVAGAVQKLAAARLGRGFIPLAVLTVAGLVEMIRLGPLSPDALILALGAPASAGAMILYGMRAVRSALGRRRRGWNLLVGVLGFLPFLFALYVVGLRGLRPLAALAGDFGVAGLLGGSFYLLVGAWLLRMLWRLTEVQRLATSMVVPAPEEEPSGPGEPT